MADQDKKISLVEIILMLMITITADVVELILTLFVAGIVVNILINIPVWLVIQFWLIMRGIRGLSYTAGSMVEFVPIINALPLRTASMLITIYLANHPGAAKLASPKSMIKKNISE
ncbi:MAG TPA: hypothetical protein VI432_01795 [Candidatus Paceibacterota bacterium]